MRVTSQCGDRKWRMGVMNHGNAWPHMRFVKVDLIGQNFPQSSCFCITRFFRYKHMHTDACIASLNLYPNNNEST